MNEQQIILAESAARHFAELASLRTEAPPDRDQFIARWAPFEEMGLQALLVPEDLGGFGGGGAEAWLVLHLAGRHALDLPVAEAIVASGLLAHAGLEAPGGVLTVAGGVAGRLGRAGAGFTFEGRLERTPWGRYADHVVSMVDSDQGPQIVCVPTAGATIVHHLNAADEPRDQLQVSERIITAGPLVPGGPDMRGAGALMRAAQMSGACRAALDLTVAHVSDRSQFGKPLAKFQAIQHQLATLAEQVAAAEAASRAAYENPRGLLEIASAKIVASLAAEAAGSIAHQMHGAIGFTWEYPLHHLTRRLIAWRSEFGNVRYWSDALGAMATARGSAAYWPMIVEGSAAA